MSWTVGCCGTSVMPEDTVYPLPCAYLSYKSDICFLSVLKIFCKTNSTTHVLYNRRILPRWDIPCRPRLSGNPLLVIVFSAFCGKRVIVQLMSGSFQHLVDGILIDMSQISAQLVTEERMINRVVGELLIPKCKSDEQPGVGSEHLIFVGIMMQCHPALVPADLQIRRNGASHSLLSRLPGSWSLEPGSWSRHAQADEITWEQYVLEKMPLEDFRKLFF